MRVAFVFPSAEVAAEYEERFKERFPDAFFGCPGRIPCGRAFDLVLCHGKTYGSRYLMEDILVRTHPTSIVALMDTNQWEAKAPICGAW